MTRIFPNPPQTPNPPPPPQVKASGLQMRTIIASGPRPGELVVGTLRRPKFPAPVYVPKHPAAIPFGRMDSRSDSQESGIQSSRELHMPDEEEEDKTALLYLPIAPEIEDPEDNLSPIAMTFIDFVS